MTDTRMTNASAARPPALWQSVKDRWRSRRTERAIRDLPDWLREDLGLPRRGNDWPAASHWIR